MRSSISASDTGFRSGTRRGRLRSVRRRTSTASSRPPPTSSAKCCTRPPAAVSLPVADARGRICGFGARATDDSVPKYLNSPESQMYRKSSVLYGLHQALPSIRRDRKVVVVEGYMDLIGLWQKGVKNVVATGGTSLTASHARALKRMSEAVILLFDGDVAGKRPGW